MTQKEKAKELVEKYAIWSWNEAKQCALIAVDEILKALPEDYQNDIWSYWQQVKQEIDKL